MPSVPKSLGRCTDSLSPEELQGRQQCSRLLTQVSNDLLEPVRAHFGGVVREALDRLDIASVSAPHVRLETVQKSFLQFNRFGGSPLVQKEFAKSRDLF